MRMNNHFLILGLVCMHVIKLHSCDVFIVFKCLTDCHVFLPRSNVNVNDALGDYSLTLVDTLDTLAVS